VFFTLALAICVARAALAEPHIDHKPPTPQANQDLVIRAKISAAGGVLEPYLYFRKPGGDYTQVAMKAKSADHYEARIPADFLAGTESIEYYLAAFAGKDLSHGFWRSKETPYKLSLKVDTLHKLIVKTTPPNAIIDLDGETVGPAPYTAALTPGPHRVTARLPGHGSVDFQFTMPKDKDLDLPLTLIPDHGASAGGIEVHAPAALSTPPPAPAPLAEAPRPAPVTTLAAAERPPPAPLPDPAPVSVAAPAALPPPAAPVDTTPIPDGMGRVSVITDPPGASVTVDGKDSGVTPLSLNLAPGQYLLNTKLAGYKDAGRVVKIAAGDKLEKALKLKPAK
jgi:hypothetical protein